MRVGLIGTGEALSATVEIVAANHVDHAGAAILEGDGIVPAVVARPLLREKVARGQVAVVFIVEPDEDVLLGNMLARGRGMAGRSSEERRTEARAKWLFGRWLAIEAGRYGLPVVEPRPWATLAERIARAVG